MWIDSRTRPYSGYLLCWFLAVGSWHSILGAILGRLGSCPADSSRTSMGWFHDISRTWIPGFCSSWGPCTSWFPSWQPAGRGARCPWSWPWPWLERNGMGPQDMARECEDICSLYITLWLFHIAMENGTFIDGLPIKHGDFPWLC